MNTHEPRGRDSLPELSDERIAGIEDALFADIARERESRTARSRRRGRLWMVGGAAAAVVVVAAVIAPGVGLVVAGSGTSGAAVPMTESGGGAEVLLDGEAYSSRDSGAAPDAATDQLATDPLTDAARDIVTSATATVTAHDVEAAVRAIGDAAAAHDGYVESMNVGTSGDVYLVDPSTGVAYDTMPYPYTPDGGWVTVRVPADELQPVIDELSGVGEVTATSINRQDVTTQTVDLEAQIDAAQTSVDRLTALMAQAQSVADLIAAESALSERQATLESYRQQLELLDDQVAMSTLTVTVAPETVPVAADPAGFGDGLAAGWNGLIATVNGIVVALGFLLPWLGVAAVAALIVWAVVRLVRARRARRTDAAASVPAKSD